MKKYNLTKKITNRAGQQTTYRVGDQQKEHDTLSLIVEGLWESGGGNIKATVRFGVLADRLNRSEDKGSVELSDVDLNVIKDSNVSRLPAFLLAPVIEAIPELAE